MLQVSPSTVRRRIHQYGLTDDIKYSDISDGNLESICLHYPTMKSCLRMQRWRPKKLKERGTKLPSLSWVRRGQQKDKRQNIIGMIVTTHVLKHIILLIIIQKTEMGKCSQAKTTPWAETWLEKSPQLQEETETVGKRFMSLNEEFMWKKILAWNVVNLSSYQPSKTELVEWL